MLQRKHVPCCVCARARLRVCVCTYACVCVPPHVSGDAVGGAVLAWMARTRCVCAGAGGLLTRTHSRTRLCVVLVQWGREVETEAGRRDRHGAGSRARAKARGRARDLPRCVLAARVFCYIACASALVIAVPRCVPFMLWVLMSFLCVCLCLCLCCCCVYATFGRMARLEDLLNRCPFLVNSVMLRQNPHNVPEWQKRVRLCGEDPGRV